jgi:phosphoribosylanthranilate isomerase
LTPDNIDEAVATARPLAVDVASGVEAEPGIKDHALMAAFLERAQAVPA